MILASVNKKDYKHYDNPRELSEYIDFAKNTYMQDFVYDKCFLNPDFQFTKEDKKLIANQFSQSLVKLNISFVVKILNARVISYQLLIRILMKLHM